MVAVASIASATLIVITGIVCYTVHLLKHTQTTRTEIKLRRTKAHLEAKHLELSQELHSMKADLNTLKLKEQGKAFR